MSFDLQSYINSLASNPGQTSVSVVDSTASINSTAMNASSMQSATSDSSSNGDSSSSSNGGTGTNSQLIIQLTRLGEDPSFPIPYEIGPPGVAPIQIATDTPYQFLIIVTNAKEGEFIRCLITRTDGVLLDQTQQIAKGTTGTQFGIKNIRNAHNIEGYTVAVIGGTAAQPTGFTLKDFGESLGQLFSPQGAPAPFKVTYDFQIIDTSSKPSYSNAVLEQNKNQVANNSGSSNTGSGGQPQDSSGAVAGAWNYLTGTAGDALGIVVNTIGPAIRPYVPYILIGLVGLALVGFGVRTVKKEVFGD